MSKSLVLLLANSFLYAPLFSSEKQQEEKSEQSEKVSEDEARVIVDYLHNQTMSGM